MKNIHFPTKSNKRIVLNTWQAIGHYSFMLIPLMLPAIDLYFQLRGESTVRTLTISTQLMLVLVSIIIGYFKWRELTYYQLEKTRTDDEFENAVLATANKLNWQIHILDDNKAEATAYNPWKSRDAQIIKIERLENKVLINSMIEQGFISVPDFFGVNRTNRNTFLNYYLQSNKIKDLNKKVIKQLKDDEERIENESEWSLKNTLKRIIAYIFSLGFWLLGIAIYSGSGSILILIIFGILGSGYIALDLYVMWTKRKKANS